MADYKLEKSGVFNVVKNLHIPEDPLNRHWVEYQAWLGAGNTPDPEFTPEQIKQSQIDAISTQADADVNAIIPEKMHARAQARRTELTILEMRGTATPDDLAEAAAIDAKWAQMKAIRVAEAAAIAALG